MKISKLLIALSILLAVFACEKDKLDVTLIEELPEEPIVIEVENSVVYRLTGTNTDAISTPAHAYKQEATLPMAANYFVASEDVEVTCTEPGGFSSRFEGGDLFQVLFYSDQFGSQVVTTEFQTLVDGEIVFASSTIPTSNCPRERLTIDFEETDGRVRGTVTGEFFRFADELVSPFDSCVNFVSLGILEASFDVDIILCE